MIYLQVSCSASAHGVGTINQQSINEVSKVYNHGSQYPRLSWSLGKLKNKTMDFSIQDSVGLSVSLVTKLLSTVDSSIQDSVGDLVSLKVKLLSTMDIITRD